MTSLMLDSKHAGGWRGIARNASRPDPWDSAFANPQGMRLSDGAPTTPTIPTKFQGGGFDDRRKRTGHTAVTSIVESLIGLSNRASLNENALSRNASEEADKLWWATITRRTRLDSWPRIAYNLFATVVIVFFMIEATLICIHPPARRASWLPFDVFVLLVFLFDCGLGFVTPVYDQATCDWRNDIRIILDYNKRQPLFLIDLCCVFPVEIFALSLSDDHYPKAHVALRAVRAIAKLTKAYHYVRLDTSFPGAETSEQSTRLQAIQAFFFLFWVVVPLHIFAVVTLALVEFEGGPTLNYIQALYWVVYTITSVGYGDITLPNTMQMVWAISLMLTGTVVLGIIVGWLGVYIQKQDQVKSDIERGLTDMASLLDHYCIEPSVRNEILSFHMHYLENYAYERHEASILMLPPSMRDKIKIHIRMKLIHMVSLFETLPVDCQSELASVLDQEIAEPGQTMIESGSVGTVMFFLGHGMVQVDYGAEAKRILRKGQFFGEISLLWEYIPSPVAQALTYCDILVLSKEDFIPIALRFPEFEEAILSKTDADLTSPNLGDTVLARLKELADSVPKRQAGSDNESQNSGTIYLEEQVEQLLQLQVRDEETGEEDLFSEAARKGQESAIIRKREASVVSRRLLSGSHPGRETRASQESDTPLSNLHYQILTAKLEAQSEKIRSMEKLMQRVHDTVSENFDNQHRQLHREDTVQASFQVFGDKKSGRKSGLKKSKSRKGSDFSYS